MMVQVYNYPWAGRLGRICTKCIYCGDDGPHFQVSSHATSCLGPECRQRRRNGGQPIPELAAEFEAKYERLARKWCQDHGMDYDTVVREMAEQHGGPPDQPKPDVEVNVHEDHADGRSG